MTDLFRCCVHCKRDPVYHAENSPNSHDTDCPTCRTGDQAALNRVRSLLEQWESRAMDGTTLLPYVSVTARQELLDAIEGQSFND